MTKETEALTLALEALQFAMHVGFDESSERQIKKGEKAYQQHRVAITAIKEALAQPAQERQWIWLSDADIADVINTTCQYTGSYEEYLIKKAERKIRSMNNG
jgi:hypothetical protein